jgi:hypothetical protein
MGPVYRFAVDEIELVSIGHRGEEEVCKHHKLTDACNRMAEGGWPQSVLSKL